jgi:hypothetical protein
MIARSVHMPMIFHTYMDIYANMYIYLYVVKISFRFVLPNFLTKFRRNETKYGLGKTKFRQNIAKFRRNIAKFRRNFVS